MELHANAPSPRSTQVLCQRGGWRETKECLAAGLSAVFGNPKDPRPSPSRTIWGPPPSGFTAHPVVVWDGSPFADTLRLLTVNQLFVMVLSRVLWGMVIGDLTSKDGIACSLEHLKTVTVDR